MLALEASGGRDRPQLEQVEWDDLLIPEPIQRDLQSIIRLLEDPALTRFLALEVPTGPSLVGHREPEDFYCQSDREPDQP